MQGQQDMGTLSILLAETCPSHSQHVSVSKPTVLDVFSKRLRGQLLGYLQAACYRRFEWSRHRSNMTVVFLKLSNNFLMSYQFVRVRYLLNWYISPHQIIYEMLSWILGQLCKKKTKWRHIKWRRTHMSNRSLVTKWCTYMCTHGVFKHFVIKYC